MSQIKTQLVDEFNINTSVPADSFVIDSSGNIGIGTTSPGENIKAWEEYCEASLNLSNQDDVGKEQEVDEHGYPLKLGDFYAS